MSLDDSSNVDRELEQMLTVENVKRQFHEQVHRINDVCWEKCVDKPGKSLDGRTQTCIINCVERFIDTSLFLTNRFAQLLQQSRSLE